MGEARLFSFTGDVTLDLAGKYYLSVDWKNNDKMPGYVLVQSKDMVSYYMRIREVDLSDDTFGMIAIFSILLAHFCVGITCLSSHIFRIL